MWKRFLARLPLISRLLATRKRSQDVNSKAHDAVDRTNRLIEDRRRVEALQRQRRAMQRDQHS